MLNHVRHARRVVHCKLPWIKRAHAYADLAYLLTAFVEHETIHFVAIGGLAVIAVTIILAGEFE